MICSTIIPTIGRSSLSRAVQSVLQQHFERDDFEIIVVNDSGGSLDEQDWMKSQQVKILHTNRHNRSVARNTGAAVARGKYLHFLDDDDWILPDAFQQLWKVARAAEAGWISGGFGLVNNQDELIKEIYPPETGNCFMQMIASEWLPLQSSWIDSKAFFEVGGFDLLFSASGQDIDLSRKIARYYEFARTPAITAKIRYGDTGSTTDYSNQIPNNRLSREKNLDLPGAFSRLRSSVRASTERTAYWQGRIVYYYLASVPWNIKRKLFAKTISRLAFALLALSISIPQMLSPQFWRGVILPHHNLVRVSLLEMEGTFYTKTVWKR
jgi:glycosyltransferase involved in cell wall biosynthesis